MPNIEDFINKNRNEFDSEEPDIKHFDNFKEKLGLQIKGKFSLSKKLMKYAAVLLIFLSLSTIAKIVFFTNFDKNEQLSTSYQNTEEFVETEQYYQKIYESSLNELKIISCESSDIQKNMIMQDIEELNKSYQELESELAKNPMDSRIKEAMISNYENKISLLQLVISEIKINC
jgi:BMFP domain-containing protein YqiC